MLGFGLDGKFRKIRAGAQAGPRLCRLPVRPQVRSGPIHTRPVAEPLRKSTDTSVPTGLPSLTIHVLDAYSHRETSLFRSTAYEPHTVASQKQLESTRIIRKGHFNIQVPAPLPTMVAGGKQCAPRSTITPNKTCSANIYRRIKRRVGRSLKRTYWKRNLVPPGKQAAYKLSGIKGSLSSLKRVPLLKQDSSCSNRQHHSSVIHKQGRRHEVGPTLCPTMENLDLVYQKTSDSESPTHFRPAERGSRQAIQVRPDHPNSVVFLPEVFQTICSRWHRPQIDLFATRFNNKLPLFVSHMSSHLQPSLAKWWRRCRTPHARESLYPPDSIWWIRWIRLRYAYAAAAAVCRENSPLPL